MGLPESVVVAARELVFNKLVAVLIIGIELGSTELPERLISKQFWYGFERGSYLEAPK